MTDLPSIYNDTSKYEVSVPLNVDAKLSRYRREMHPEKSVEEVIAYLIQDSLIRLGMWEEQDVAIREGRAPKGSGWKR